MPMMTMARMIRMGDGPGVAHCRDLVSRCGVMRLRATDVHPPGNVANEQRSDAQQSTVSAMTVQDRNLAAG